MNAQSTRYAGDAENRPGGAATISSRTSTLTFDGSAATGELLPGPADLLAAALAACILKNVERFSGLLPFRYDRADVHVEVEREEPPPRIVRARYTLRIVTDETEQRVELLHRNIVRFGTVTNTLAAACDVSGTILAERPRSGPPGP
ncbi:MAG TPA: OsmC family protein [Gaiellaceae bacterium]|nr:OsmC family protein [Gaiellaceae bacterium]